MTDDLHQRFKNKEAFALRILLGIYLVIACIAYGHSWGNSKPLGTDDPSRAENRFFLAAISGIAWPIYINVCIFEPNPTKPLNIEGKR